LDPFHQRSFLSPCRLLQADRPVPKKIVFFFNGSVALSLAFFPIPQLFPSLFPFRPLTPPPNLRIPFPRFADSFPFPILGLPGVPLSKAFFFQLQPGYLDTFYYSARPTALGSTDAADQDRVLQGPQRSYGYSPFPK